MMNTYVSKRIFSTFFILAGLSTLAVFSSSGAAKAEVCNIKTTPASIDFGTLYSGDAGTTSANLSWQCKGVGMFESASYVNACYTYEPVAADLLNGNQRVMRGISGEAVGYSMLFDFYNDSSILGARKTANFGTQPNLGGTISGSIVANYNVTTKGSIPAAQNVPAGVYQTQVYAYIPYKGYALSSGTCVGTKSISTSMVNVTVTVSPKCDVRAQDIDFGVQSTLGEALTALGRLYVSCTLNQPYKVSLSSSAADPKSRQMASASGEHITYGLYKDSAFTQPWGTAEPLEGVGSGVEEQIPVYARIPAQPTPSSGSYNDIVTVTVEY